MVRVVLSGLSTSILLLLLVLAEHSWSKAVDLSGLVKAVGSARSNQVASIRSGSDVVAIVGNVWDSVVAPDQDGLVDPKISASAVSKTLSPNEAFYHYRAAMDGIVDSARLLISFGIAASVAECAELAEDDKLIRLILKGDAKTLRALLADGVVDANTFTVATSFELSPLHLAVSVSPAASSNGEADVVLALLEAGANPNVRARYEATPLMVAAALNRPASVLVLLKHDAILHDSHAFAKTTALHFAAEMNALEAMNIICTRLQRTSDESTCDNKSYCESQHNVKCDDMRNALGGTPLHTAADCNKPEAVRLLIRECGCDANALLNGDSTPLYLAAQRGFTNVVETLADMGADLNVEMIKDSKFAQERAKNVRRGLMPLEHSGKDQLNVPYDALNKNTERGNGATSLHAAAENGHLATVDALLKLGAKQTSAMEGATPLLIAIQYNHPEIALRLLRERNVLPNAKAYRDGAFPLFAASGSRSMTRVALELLARDDVDINAKNNAGASALSHALFRENFAIVRRLLEKPNLLVDRHTLNVALMSEYARMNFLPDLLKKADRIVRGHFAIDLAMDTVNGASLLFSTPYFEDVDFDKLIDDEAVVHAASRSGNLDVLKGLELLKVDHAIYNLRAGKSLAYATSLYLASAQGHQNVVEWLLTVGAEPNRGALNKEGHNISPMVVACEKGNVNVANNLATFIPLDEALDPFPTCLEIAASHGRAEFIRHFISYANASRVLEIAAHSMSIAPKSVLALVDALTAGNKLKSIPPGTLSICLTALISRQLGQNPKALLDHLPLLKMLRSFPGEWVQSAMTGMNPFHAAVVAYAAMDQSDDDASKQQRRALEMVEILLSTVQHIPEWSERLMDLTTRSRMTPLALAVEAERPMIVRKLCSVIDIKMRIQLLELKNGQNHETPLEAALRLRDAELIRSVHGCVAKTA